MLIAGALLGVVLGTRIHRDQGYPELRTMAVPESNNSHSFLNRLNTLKKTGGNPAFFIDFNPSSLTAIATLSGKVIPYLSSSIMALVAFFAARRIIVSSKDTNKQKLLSPHQISLLIGLLGGSNFTPLKDCVKHHFKSKQKWISPLPHAFTALAAVTSLGIIIPLADTWFSITVTPATIATVKKSDYTSTFGRAFNLTQCDGTLTWQAPGMSAQAPCNLDSYDPNVYLLYGVEESVATLDSVSSKNRVGHYQDTTTGDVYHYMGDTAFNNDLIDARYSQDFRTTTFAVHTQCTPMTTSCLPPLNQDGYARYVSQQYEFSCGSGFTGSLLSNGATKAANYNLSTHKGGAMAGISFSTDAQLNTKINDLQFASFQNPLYFGAWSVGWQAFPENDTSSSYTGPWDYDPQIFWDEYSNYIWMLNCSSTLYELNYTMVNGSIVYGEYTPSLPDAGGFLSLPFVSGLPAGSLSLGLASTSVSKALNSTDLANQWAFFFSHYAVTLLAGALVFTNNTMEQTRNNAQSATRVPMVPLFLLLGLKMLYCFAVLILALAAWHFTDPQVTQSVKERLTVKGLAAAYFGEGASHQKVAVKNVEELFENTGTGNSKNDVEAARGSIAEEKVAILPTELGGWQFVKLAAGKAWTAAEPIIQSEAMAQANAGDFGTDGKDAAEWVSLLTK